ncbi:MAG: hypothetical protein ACLRFE_04565 [Clostridia bacterium]
MFEKCLNKKCDVTVKDAAGYYSSTPIMYRGMITAIENDYIEVEVEKVLQYHTIVKTKSKGKIYIKKEYIVAVMIIDEE